MKNHENPRSEQTKNAQDHETQKEHNAAEKEMINKPDDSGYTPEENQFADGKGTQLDEEIDGNEAEK